MWKMYNHARMAPRKPYPQWHKICKNPFLTGTDFGWNPYICIEIDPLCSLIFIDVAPFVWPRQSLSVFFGDECPPPEPKVCLSSHHKLIMLIYCRVPPPIGLQVMVAWVHEWRAYKHAELARWLKPPTWWVTNSPPGFGTLKSWWAFL